MTSRDEILGRVRAALAGVDPAPEPVRDYLTAHTADDPAALADLLADNLGDYRAIVHRTGAAGLPDLLARILGDAATVVVPDGLPDAWLAGVPARRLRDRPPLTPAALDAADAVVTGCAVAIAETGTIVLDAGPAQGRRALTLVPDLHVCVVRVPDQVVASVPLALPRLEPARPLTWISGPSATSDIELERVEGVHGPRTLHAVLLEG